MHAPFRVQARQGLNIFRVNSAVSPARLPGLSGVIAKLLFLDPDGSFGEQIDTAHVVPVCVAYDHIRDLFGLNTGQLHRFVGANIVEYRPFLEPSLAVKSAVKKNVAASAADQP